MADHFSHSSRVLQLTIKVKKSKIRCEDVTDFKLIRNKVSIENSPNLKYLVDNRKINNFFSWNFEIITCDGIRKIIPCSIDLRDNSSEGIVDLPELTFNAKEFKVIEKSVKNQINLEKERIPTNPNITPDFISGVDEAYPNEDLVLIARGGLATPGSYYVWTEGSCDGKVIQKSQSNSLKIKASNSTKKYFVHITNNLGENTSCVSLEVKILKISKSADKIIGPSYVCQNDSKQITLEAVGGGLGESPSGIKAEWIWRINNESGTEIKKGRKIIIDQPKSTTTYFVSPEGVNKVPSLSYIIEVIEPTDLSNSIIFNSLSEICEGQKVNFELRGGFISKNAEIKWFESNSDHASKLISNNKNFNWFPVKSSTYEVVVQDKCIISKKLQSNIHVIENSKLPVQIEIDSSKAGRIVKLNIDESKSRLNLNSHWIWYGDNPSANFNSQNKPLNVPIYNIDSTSINLKTSKNGTKVYFKAFGDCESPNKFIDINVPRKLDKYVFISIGVSSNVLNNLATKVITIGSHKVYFRTKQSFNSSSIGDYSTVNSFLTDGNKITNFPNNSGNYYSFNGEKVSIRSSYTLGFFLNQNNIKFYLGAGVGTQNYYYGIDIAKYQTNTKISNSWAKHINYDNFGAEIEAGISIKLTKYLSIMAGGSYLMGPTITKGFGSIDCNLAYTLEL